MSKSAGFASRIFRASAVYGVLVLTPSYLVPVPDPWRLSHFGFVGIALVFQGVFWIISRDPLRYIALIPLCIMEKLVFGVPAIALLSLGKADPVAGLFGGLDLLWAAMFAIAWRRL